MLKFPSPEHWNFTTTMNFSAHGDENATFQFFARIIDIPKEKQWSGDPSHAPQPHEPHKLGWGGSPDHCFPLGISMILAKNWNVAFSSPCAETFIFVVKFQCSGGGIFTILWIIAIFAQSVTLYALKCLSVWMSGWRFCKSSPKYQFWHCKNY